MLEYGVMADKKETTVQKANATMRQFIQSWPFIVIVIIVGLACAATTIYYVPDFIGRDMVIFYRVAVPLIAVLLTLLVSWLVFLARAPGLEIKEEQEKEVLPPSFVPDKNRFIKSMSEIRDIAYNCLQLKYLSAVLRESGHQTAQGITEESQRAAEKYSQLRGQLEDEAVAAIGSDAFDGVNTEFQALMSLLDADAAAEYGDKRPDVDVASHRFRYDKALKAVVERYDKISQSPQPLEPPTSAT
jgi:hypothetical protein